MDPFSAIIQGGTTLIGGALQHRYNQEMFEEQKKHNKQMAEIEQGYAQENMELQANLAERNSLDAWKRSEQSAIKQNQRNLDLYNQTQSTQAKMREMEMAGLNKNLLQGTPSQGGASAGGMGTSAPGQVGLASAQVQPAQMAKIDIMSAMTDLAYKSALIKNIDANTRGKEIENEIDGVLLYDERKANLDKAKEEIGKIATETTNTSLQNDLLRIEGRIAKATETTNVEIRKKELSKAIEETHKIKADKEFTESENARKEELQGLEVTLRGAMIRETVSQTRLNKQLSAESAKRVDKLINDIALDTEKWTFEKGDFKNDAERQEKYLELYKTVQTEIMGMQLESAEKQALIHAIGNGVSSIMSALGNITGAGIIKGIFSKTPKPNKVGY